MGKVVILTDSSSGIRQAEAQQLGISVLPMPFFINGETLFDRWSRDFNIHAGSRRPYRPLG